MTYSLEVLKSAETEISDSFTYYEEKVAGLGRRFLVAVESALNQIVKTPELYQLRKIPFRSCPIKGFPYLIFYAIEGDVIVVYSLFNTAQDPSKWPRNKKER